MACLRHSVLLARAAGCGTGRCALGVRRRPRGADATGCRGNGCPRLRFGLGSSRWARMSGGRGSGGRGSRADDCARGRLLAVVRGDTPRLCSHKGELRRVGIIPGRYAPPRVAPETEGWADDCAGGRLLAVIRGGTPRLCSHKGELRRVGIIPGRYAPALLAKANCGGLAAFRGDAWPAAGRRLGLLVGIRYNPRRSVTPA